MLYKGDHILSKIRFKKQKHVCGIKLARHWLVMLFATVLLVLIIVNFFWVHRPGRSDAWVKNVYVIFLISLQIQQQGKCKANQSETSIFRRT